MKKHLFPFIAGLGLACSAHAAVIFTEDFSYSDGPLSLVSSSAWTNYSSTPLQVDVAGGKVNVSQSEVEDVARPLPGGPYKDVNISLYASFVVNFSALPQSGLGTYFVCFKDGATFNLKARTFATISGAGSGMFRVGIANGGNTPVVIPRDLALGTDYLLVIRYNSGTGATTLWINPGSEGATSDTADGSDSTMAADISTFVLRQSNAAGGMGVLTLDDLKVGTAFGDVVSGGNPALNPPFISNIPDQRIARDGVTPVVPFYVIDGETAHGSLTLSAESTDTDLVPVDNIVFENNSGDSNRTVTVTPAPGQQGVAQINVTVTDGDYNIASRSFLVIVGAPTISTFASITTPKDTPTPAIPFTVNDTEGDGLTLSAASTNETVVPVSGISFGGDEANRTVTITPAAGANGLSRVTIFVWDGFNTVSNSFVITVFPTLHVVLDDAFDYPDGPLRTVASHWGTHSGTVGEAMVLDGKLLLTGVNGEDVSATFTNPPSFFDVSFPPHEGWILYSRFTVNFSALPNTANGEYFAHFRNGGTGNSFGGKIFVTTTGAADGKLRLGVSNSANAPANAVLPTDLDLGTTYTVVTRYNVGTGQTTLWINPSSEADPGVTATDSTSPFTTETYSFRESGGIGSMAIDDLKVGTSFSDVYQPQPVLTIMPSGGDLIISWTGVGTLQFTDDLLVPPANTSWESLTGVPSPYTTSTAVAAHRFFRVTVP